MDVVLPALAETLRDRYALERELGRGGMATVYLATDLKHKRSVALKVLHPDLAQTLGPERFRREVPKGNCPAGSTPREAPMPAFHA